MAVPLLKSIQDCGDFSKSVEPFIPQLYALPGQILANLASPSGLKQLYVDTNPLVSAFGLSLVVGAVCLVVSEVNRNWSQIDRLWSIVPNLYVLHLAAWARLASVPHSRLDLVAVFTTAWSVRFSRCGQWAV